jgi:CheY-like chemotaxis protein
VGGKNNMHVCSWRVILAEDDALIRLSTVDMLESLGHSVLEASDARAVLALLESEDADILVTDVNLPGMSGIELAAEAVRRKPGLRVVFASGYDVGLGSMTSDVRARAAVLQKPYSEQDMGTALRSVMEMQA